MFCNEKQQSYRHVAYKSSTIAIRQQNINCTTKTRCRRFFPVFDRDGRVQQIHLKPYIASCDRRIVSFQSICVRIISDSYISSVRSTQAVLRYYTVFVLAALNGHLTARNNCSIFFTTPCRSFCFFRPCCLTFRHRASSIQDRRFATLQRTLFIYLIDKYISLSDICLTVHH